MPVSPATRLPSLMTPTAPPAQAAVIGTPASNSASEPPHTVAMDDEPFDSRMSDTMRRVYGNWSYGGSSARSAPSAGAPCPTSPRDGPRIGLPSPVEDGGKIVVNHDEFVGSFGPTIASVVLS